MTGPLKTVQTPGHRLLPTSVQGQRRDRIENFIRLFVGSGPTYVCYRHPEQRFKENCYLDPAKAAERAIALSDADHDVWTSTVEFKQGTQERKTKYVRQYHRLCIDIDVDPDPTAYPTLQEAKLGVDDFAGKLGLPAPLVVNSGGGLHAYWITQPMDPETWFDLSSRLKVAAKTLGLKVKDPKVITHPTQIMRPPGLKNYKLPGNPRPTYTVSVGKAYSVDALQQALAAFQPLRTDAPKRAKKNTDSLTLMPAGGMDPRIFCRQIVKSLEEGGKNDGYWLWTGMLQLAGSIKDLADRQTFIEKVSNQHPGYLGIDYTGAKADTFDSPPTCAWLEELRPEPCQRCFSRGHIQSLASLWKWKRVIDPARQAEIDKTITTLRTAYNTLLDQDPMIALAEVERLLLECKARDADLAREIGFKLMAFLKFAQWPQDVVINAGVAAGIEHELANHWAKSKLFECQ